MHANIKPPWVSLTHEDINKYKRKVIVLLFSSSECGCWWNFNGLVCIYM